MNGNRFGRSFVTVNPSHRLAGAAHWLASGFAVASYLLVLLALVASMRLPGKPGWPEAALILATTLATLVSYSRRLPLQNVLLAAAVIGLMGGGIHAIGVTTAIPFGPFSYTDNAGPRILGTLAWPLPFVWIIVILNSRDVARLIMRPWRKLRPYGFWLIGVTAALAVLFDVALEPFAVRVQHYWLWHPTRLPVTWVGAPVTNFLGWLVAALLILAFTTPVLIDKRQQRSTHRPPNYHPLIVWLLAVALFAVGDATKELWLATSVTGCLVLVVAIFAWRGANW